MFGFGKLSFRGVDKKKISDEEHVQDYQSAEAIGRVRLGKLCLYYKDLGRKYYVPYEYIDRSFTRISECQPDDSPAWCSHFYCSVEGDANRTEVYLIPHTDFECWLRLYGDRSTKQKEYGEKGGSGWAT